MASSAPPAPLIERYRHALRFYVLATVIPWTLWAGAAYLSHRPVQTDGLMAAGSLLALLGLFSPMLIAFALMLPDPALRRDCWSRLFRLGAVRPLYLALTGGLMLASILLAQAISLLFGHSASQFALTGHFSFTAGLLPAWVLLFLAPLVEELAWHTYGTDCLRLRFSLFTTSLLFAVYWALWHLPLSFIKDYYHSNLAATGWIYSLNFSLSLIPYVLLMNWLYYKTGRNILVAIVFHITAGFFNEIFATHPDSKVIQTVLLLALALFLLARERDFFFQRAYGPETGGGAPG